MAWVDFFVAELGAAAALAGLLFVGISLNMAKILSYPTLPNRALQALALLVAILLIGSLLLVPGQSTVIEGIEVLLVGGVAWTFLVRLALETVRESPGPQRRLALAGSLRGQAATLPYLAAGALLLTIGADGLYLVAAAFAVSFAGAIVDAWVLLVEINR
jgi:hypothetical protein